MYNYLRELKKRFLFVMSIIEDIEVIKLVAVLSKMV